MQSFAWEGVWRSVLAANAATSLDVRKDAGHTLKSSLKVRFSFKSLKIFRSSSLSVHGDDRQSRSSGDRATRFVLSEFDRISRSRRRYALRQMVDATPNQRAVALQIDLPVLCVSRSDLASLSRTTEIDSNQRSILPRWAVEHPWLRSSRCWTAQRRCCARRRLLLGIRFTFLYSIAVSLPSRQSHVSRSSPLLLKRWQRFQHSVSS